MSSVPHVHQNKGLDMIFLDLVPFTLHTISHSIHTTHNISFHSHYTQYLTPFTYTQYLTPKCQRRKTKQEKLSPSMNSKCKCEKSMGFFSFFFLTMHGKNWVIKNCPYQRVKKTLNTHSSTPHTVPCPMPQIKNHVQHTTTSEQTNKQTKQCVFHNTRKIVFLKIFNYYI
jgi:hypothetical protein